MSARATDDRPAVDVVIPFLGSERELDQLTARMSRIRRRAGDTLLIVDNTPAGPPSRTICGVHVLAAPARQAPGHARNRGAEQGRASWIVFLDADVVPAEDLLDAYFTPMPCEGTGLLAGGLRDEEVPTGAPPAARYAYLRGAMSHEDTLGFGAWGYPKSANIACRRSAFEAVGGFREDIRAAEDADLTYRLREAGWSLERREHAAAVHSNRATLRALIAQKAAWGAGGAWLSRAHPGSLSLARGPGLAWWLARETAREAARGVLHRDRDALILAALRPVEALAYELGRLRPNERHG